MFSKITYLAAAILAFVIGVSLASIWLPKTFIREVKDNKLWQQLGNESGVVVVKSGSSFGECMKDCNEEVMIENTDVRVVISSNDKRRFLDKKLEGRIAEQEWKSLLQLIDSRVLMALPDIVGCPDCFDGGAAWIEVTFGDGTSKRVTYEYRKPPEQIKELAEKLTTIGTPFTKRLMK